MSRIDEALRRHSTVVSPSERSGPLGSPERVGRQRDDLALDAYPRERPISSPTSAARAASGSIASPVRPIISVHTETFAAAADRRLIVGPGQSSLAIEQYRRLA